MQFLKIVWDRFGDRTPPAVSPRGFRPALPDLDTDDDGGGGEVVGESVNGMTVIIEYRDAKGAASTRQVSCIRIENAKGKRYLRAFCHHRSQCRLFVIERIDGVIDAETGEELANGASYFNQFIDDRISASTQGWGLSVKQRADLGAGLSVLTFLSRCDGQIHPNEASEIETFVAAWWMRAEIRAELPDADISAYARRLAPDVEAFAIAAQRVQANPPLARLISGYARRVVEADGQIAPEESYWISRLIDWMDEAA